MSNMFGLHSTVITIAVLYGKLKNKLFYLKESVLIQFTEVCQPTFR